MPVRRVRTVDFQLLKGAPRERFEGAAEPVPDTWIFGCQLGRPTKLLGGLVETVERQERISQHHAGVAIAWLGRDHLLERRDCAGVLTELYVAGAEKQVRG